MPAVRNAVDAADLLRVRDARNELFGRALFAPNAWDILLYLQTAGAPRRSSAICDALDLQEATAERWIAVLESEGLIEREGAAAIRLTPEARQDMETALAASLS